MIKGSPKALKCLGEETLVCFLVCLTWKCLLYFSFLCVQNAVAAKGSIPILQRMLHLKIDPNAKQMVVLSSKNMASKI